MLLIFPRPCYMFFNVYCAVFIIAYAFTGHSLALLGPLIVIVTLLMLYITASVLIAAIMQNLTVVTSLITKSNI